MAIKPILFNTEMVRASLDGRKSCTRRLVKFLSGENFKWTGYIKDGTMLYNGRNKPCIKTQPYHPGDILYVRETVWQKIGYYLDVDGETKPSWYNEFRYVASDEKPETGWNYGWAKRPSIHMPKEAARIWLKVTNVRVERLQEITEDGVKAEGAIDNRGFIHSPENEYDSIHTAREHFAEIWNSTIKKSDIDRYGWNANPWVWVIEFERCEKPKREKNHSEIVGRRL